VNAGDSMSPLDPLPPADRGATALPAGAIEKLRAEGHELLHFLRSLGTSKPVVAAPGRPATTVASDGVRGTAT